MCRTENLLRNRQSQVAGGHEETRLRMERYCTDGTKLPKDSSTIQNIFSGGQGIKIDYLGVFLRALDCKVVDYSAKTIDPETSDINDKIMEKYVEQKREIKQLKELMKAKGIEYDEG